MRYKPKSIAALQLALGGGYQDIRKDRRWTSQSERLAGKFGDYDATGALFRECRKGE